MSVDLSEYRIASVVLNYNSDADLHTSMPMLRAQQGIHHRTIIVDNASSSECVQRMRAWLQHECPDAVTGTVAAVEAWVRANPEEARNTGRVYLILNHENRGYSAGNNVGIRLAEMLGSDAVLIANPDMRFESPHYIAKLAHVLFADDRAYIAASRIVGLGGHDQSPLREQTFWEELFWRRFYPAKLLKPISYILPICGSEPVQVPKVSGCCLLLRMTFLQATGYLDEHVFLYCEEPILSARVRMHGGCILYVPTITAVHAHVRSDKTTASSRMHIYFRSRRYYLEHCSGYGHFGLLILRGSYLLLETMYRIKSFLR